MRNLGILVGICLGVLSAASVATIAALGVVFLLGGF